MTPTECKEIEQKFKQIVENAVKQQTFELNGDTYLPGDCAELTIEF